MYNLVFLNLYKDEFTKIDISVLTDKKIMKLSDIDSITMQFSKNELIDLLIPNNPFLKNNIEKNLYVKYNDNNKNYKVLYSDCQKYFERKIENILLEKSKDAKFIKQIINFAYKQFKPDYNLLNKMRNKLNLLKNNQEFSFYDFLDDLYRKICFVERWEKDPYYLNKKRKVQKFSYLNYRELISFIYEFDKQKMKNTNNEDELIDSTIQKDIDIFHPTSNNLDNDGQIKGQIKFF